MKGFGKLIEDRRNSVPMSREELARRMGQSAGTVRRLEEEEGSKGPSVEQVNALVASLPLSAEELLEAMGVNLSAPATARLPRPLLDELLKRSPAEWDALLLLLQRTQPPAIQKRAPRQ